MVIKGGYKIYNNYRLEKDGICTETVIREIYQEMHKKVGIYKFRVGDKTYSGRPIYVGSNVGDTISIVYLPSNPKINRSNTVIKKNCDK